MSYLHVEESQHERVRLPTPALVFAAVIAVLTITLAAVARTSNVGTLRTTSSARPVAVRALVFSDRPNGAIGVRDLHRQADLAPIVSGEASFVRGALRALARQRRLAGIGPEIPFHLIKWSDGRLTLDDSSTANHLELQAYGSANVVAFEGLLTRR